MSKQNFKGSLIRLTILNLSFALGIHLITGQSALAQSTATLESRLIVPDGGAADQAGASVAIHADTALFGAPFYRNPALSGFTRTGAAYIAKRVGSSWEITQRLLAPDGADQEQFGAAVAFDGDWAVVGAPMDDVIGAVYLYQRSGSTWIYRQKFSSTLIQSYFGISVSLLADTLVVGAYGHQSYTGAAYIYKLNGGTWSLAQTLAAFDGGTSDFFGCAVDISNTTLIVGAYGDDAVGNSSGAAYVYRLNGATWNYSHKLIPADGAAGDGFGWSVDVDGAVTVIGVPNDGDVGTSTQYTGSAYVFRDNGSQYLQEAKLVASDATSNDNFGRRVALSGSAILVGSHRWMDESSGLAQTGTAYYFRFDGSVWREELNIIQTLPYGYTNDHFASAVALDGDLAAIGAPDEDAPMLSNTGIVWIFRLNNPVSTLRINQSLPSSGFIDPLEDRDAANQSTLFGIRNVSLTFSEAVTSSGGSALGTGNFQVRCVRNGQAATDLQTNVIPSVTQVTGSGAGPYQLQLSQRICLGAWTEIKAVNVVNSSGTPISTSGYENRVVYGNLPMDITQDGKVLGTDIDRWLAINNNVYNPAPLTKLQLLDQKRDGVVNGSDINRAIQLINGTAGTTFRAWSGFDMGVRP